MTTTFFHFLNFLDPLPFRSGCRTPILNEQTIRASFKFLLPSLIYTVNNNIYLAGLLLVPPPIWITLRSFRTVVTACIYKFILNGFWRYNSPVSFLTTVY